MANYKKNMNIGLAGEYMVAGMLSIQGWYASLTLKNYPDIDILAHKIGAEKKPIGIQVKSTLGKSSVLVGRLHRGASDKDVEETIVKGLYIFVVFDKDCENRTSSFPTFYIVPQKDMIKLVRETNDNYFNKPREISVRDTQPVAIKIKDLEKYKEKWEMLDK